MKRLKSSSLRWIAAALLCLVAVPLCLIDGNPAFALFNDQSRIFSRRFYSDYHPTYYRVTINYNDPSISTGQAFGALGQNAFIKAIDCHVTTAFNAATTNVVTFGTTSASANEIVASGITAGTAGIYHLTSAAGLGVAVTSSADITLYAKYAQTGTAATAGSVTCVIEYVPNNDM